jgi:hypothetical protein
MIFRCIGTRYLAVDTNESIGAQQLNVLVPNLVQIGKPI